MHVPISASFFFPEERKLSKSWVVSVMLLVELNLSVHLKGFG